MNSALFSRFEENFRPVWERVERFSWKGHCFPVLKLVSGQCDDCENFDAHKCDLAKTCCAWLEKSVLYNFHGKRAVFPFWSKFQASVTIVRTLTLKNAIRPKGAAHDREKERFVQVLYKARCFPVLKQISGECDDCENFAAQKCDLAKTCCPGREKERFVQFLWKAHCFPVLREFETSVTIFRSLTLKNAIWPKRAAHDLKRAFCTIFMKSALFSRFEENLRPVSRFSELCRSKMRFGQNVLRMTWK